MRTPPLQLATHACAAHTPSCFRYAAGDLIAQSFEKDSEDAAGAKKGFDWERAAVFMAFGTFLAGPVYVHANSPPAFV